METTSQTSEREWVQRNSLI